MIIGKVIEQRLNETINELKHFSVYISASVSEQQQQMVQWQQQQQQIQLSSDIPSGGSSSTIRSSTGTNWPYITIPSYDMYSSNVLDRIQSNHISLLPFVSSDQIWGWSSYSTINQEWAKIQQDKQKDTDVEYNIIIDGGDSNRHGLDFDFIPNDIYQLKDENDEASNDSIDEYVYIDFDTINITSSNYPLAPIWQTNVLPSVTDVNFNALSISYMKQLYDTMQSSPDVLTVSLGPMINNNNNNRHWIPSLQHRRNQDGSSSEDELQKFTPVSAIVAPVLYDSRQDGRRMNDDDMTSSSQIVAMIVSEFQWTQLISDLIELQYFKTSMLIHVESNCSQQHKQESILFRTMDENKLEQVNRSDYPTVFPKYVGYQIELDHVMNSSFVLAKHDTSCSYTLTIYPTRAVVEIYSLLPNNTNTNNSNRNVANTMNLSMKLYQLLPLVIGIAFFIVLITFLLFDRSVRTKIRMIINTAAESNRIISSLFPSTVRHRLFGGGDTKDGKDGCADDNTNDQYDMMTPVSQQLASKHVGSGRRAVSSDESIDKSTDDFFDDDDDNDDAIVFKTKPIADLFPEVTIMVRE
jgi:hypothetical protein